MLYLETKDRELDVKEEQNFCSYPVNKSWMEIVEKIIEVL